jgi:RNA recognition motif-containing protein
MRGKETLMNIYVGNLPYTTTEDELRQVFEPYGNVSAVRGTEHLRTFTCTAQKLGC